MQHSHPGSAVLVNRFLALAAGRYEPGDQADWFILRALQRYCGTDADKSRHCTDWHDLKALARRGRLRRQRRLERPEF